MATKKETFRKAFVASIPILCSYLFLGMAYGILMQEAGFGWAASLLTSAVVYTGAFQFVLITFLSSGASILTIAVTALFMNSRQSFYALTFLDDFKHMGTCTKDCTDAECKCPCHLFNKIMACTTLEEIEAMIEATPEDVLRSLSEEQIAQVEAHMEALMPAPLPAIVIEESEPPVESEICRATVNYTDVAPFGEPVTGGEN